MAKFDSMHFDNSKGHALASLKTAEKALQDGDLEGARIAFNCARPYIKIMENEANNEGAPKNKDGEWKELQNRLASLCDKYHEMKEATENWVDDTTENEEVEEEKNEDASIVKLNVAVRNVINILSAIKESAGGLASIELIDSTLLLLDELAEVVENDLDDIRERLEDVKKDAKIVTMVENVKDAFDARLRDKLVEDSIDRLKIYKNREHDDIVELTNEAIFAAIHQDDDDLETVFEEVNNLDDKVWTANRFAVRYDDGLSESLELTYEVTKKEEWFRDLDLFIKQGYTRFPLATIRFKYYSNDTIRKISALGCEYAIAFDHFNEIF